MKVSQLVSIMSHAKRKCSFNFRQVQMTAVAQAFMPNADSKVGEGGIDDG